MRDKNKIQKQGVKRFFKVFSESLITVSEIAVAIVIVLTFVGFLLFSWAWGLNKAFIYKDIFFVIIPIIITLVFLAITTKLEDL